MAPGGGRSRHRVPVPRAAASVPRWCRRTAPPSCPDGAGELRRLRAQREARMLPRNRVTNRTKNGCANHRVGDAGAVLAVVNALRFASTRPAAGPAGIDGACARPRLAVTRWSPSWRSFMRGLTPSTCRRNVASSRQCRTALLRFAATASGARNRPMSQGTVRAHPSRQYSPKPEPGAAPRSQDQGQHRGRVHQRHLDALDLLNASETVALHT